MIWIKKEVGKRREIKNISRLSSLEPSIIPDIKEVSKDRYFVRKGRNLSLTDIAPGNFIRLCQNLLVPLYQHTQGKFTPGIYKYFLPSNVDSTVPSDKYLPYVTRKLAKIAKRTINSNYSDFDPSTLIWYLKSLRKTEKYLSIQNWTPSRGFSLLHGDLHTGNIIKRNGKYLLIDFEYLRYGPPELEVSNLLLSALLRFRKIGESKNCVQEKFENYKKKVGKLCFIDNQVMPFFLLLSSCLFYLGACFKRDLDGMTFFKKIVDCSSFPSKGGIKDGN